MRRHSVAAALVPPLQFIAVDGIDGLFGLQQLMDLILHLSSSRTEWEPRYVVIIYYLTLINLE